VQIGGECSGHWEIRNAYKFLLERLKGKDNQEGLGENGKII
jgi:hypothetical protein